MANPQGELRSAIEAADAQFVDAFGRGDAAAIASLYAENAEVLPPNGEPLAGKAAVQAFWQVPGGRTMRQGGDCIPGGRS